MEVPFSPAVEIGWRLGSEYWGKGLATEGAKAVLNYGFKKCGLKEIVSFTVPANVRSIRVMEKIGMKRDLAGDFHHPKLPKDHPLSLHVLYRVNHDSHNITFRSLCEFDMPIIKKWFNQPHVVKFYSLRNNWTEEEVFKKFIPYIKQEKPVQCFVILNRDQPIGFIQMYPIKEFSWPDQGLPDEIINHAAGIDIFIGELDLINKGFGTDLIKKFLDTYIWINFDYCIVDPNKENFAMIRCNEKIGFKEHKIIQTEDKLGRLVKLKLMILKNPGLGK